MDSLSSLALSGAGATGGGGLAPRPLVFRGAQQTLDRRRASAAQAPRSIVAVSRRVPGRSNSGVGSGGGGDSDRQARGLAFAWAHLLFDRQDIELPAYFPLPFLPSLLACIAFLYGERRGLWPATTLDRRGRETTLLTGRPRPRLPPLEVGTGYSAIPGEMSA